MLPDINRKMKLFYGVGDKVTGELSLDREFLLLATSLRSRRRMHLRGCCEELVRGPRGRRQNVEVDRKLPGRWGSRWKNGTGCKIVFEQLMGLSTDISAIRKDCKIINQI